MLTSLGMRSRVASLESKYLLRFLKLSAEPNRLSNYPYGKTVNPFSLQFATSAQISISNFSLPCANALYEAKRLFHATETEWELVEIQLFSAYFTNYLQILISKVEVSYYKDGYDAFAKDPDPEILGLFAKLKYYLKRYWYIAIPIHIANCIIWFIVLYIAVQSGLDVVALLEKCHVPNYIVHRVKSVPSNAGVAVVAFLLYKIVIPLRYATTLLLIQLSFPVLRRLGIMTVKEVKYKMRLKYTNKVKKIKRRYQLKFNRAGSLGNKKRQNISGFKKS
ncbi:hypothetical protein LOAG_16886 [Loa loa]|uniref:DUF1279 domain-containing protein n=1 Tax=Loa loa TaxID=7209 RepID=A0A1S0UK65_LOALO|nr:hypothetical protein LOAG_16886 [Loa loa]EJD76112.1 hypothetical protein LOAG_16886 [Loa loa]